MTARKKPSTDRWDREAAELREMWERAAMIELAGDVRVVISLYPQARKGIWQLRTQAYVPETHTQPRRAGLVAFEVPAQRHHSMLMGAFSQLHSLDLIVKGWRENEAKKE